MNSKENKSTMDFYLINQEEYSKTTIKDLDEKKMFQEMCILREMELLLDGLYQKNEIQGFCHLVVGQEPIYIALKNVINGDKVIGSYRCHGLAYSSGIPIQEIVCETLGRANGNCKGKGGSMHLYNETFFGGHGIVGAQVSLGIGIAYALKYKEHANTPPKNVCFAFYGDGASNQGQVFESFNMAKLWKLPVVFVCENNFYGMWTPEKNVSSNSEYYKRGINIPGIRVDGNDIEELHRAFAYSKEYAKANGPIIIQIDTYRTCGHSCVDKTNFYRDQKEVEEKKHCDGLSKLKAILEVKTSKKDVEKIETEAKNIISDLHKFASNSNYPSVQELYTEVLKE
ncbi:Pyruvate dehydrogenase E1 component subunit alpha, mitochondrial [Nosema granulosis]|uniref:Pyruvate dehydrogenase E1 component subunit alpha, mitochondrial n=1 Tax=Nosema granulosis TaxID=83296 RepID=A0A9P6H1H0_9MICR|nr:Pyruvate dehydrogenase E1 component subunit alpha, mitochondrial [Nosema granulosis]